MSRGVFALRARLDTASESASQTLSEVFEAMAAATAAESSALRESSHAGSSEGMAADLFADEPGGMELVGDEDAASQRHDWRAQPAAQLGSTGRNEEESVKDNEQSPLPDRLQRSMSGEATCRNEARRQRTNGKLLLTADTMQEALARRFWDLSGAEENKVGQFLAVVMREFREQLGPVGKQQLWRGISEFFRTSDVEQFAHCIQEIVDEHQVVVLLPYTTAKHGPYIRHFDAAAERGNLQHQQDSVRSSMNAGGRLNLDFGRRLEESAMLPNIMGVVPNPWGAITYDSRMHLHRDGDGSAALGINGTGPAIQGQLPATRNHGALHPSMISGPVSCFCLQDTQLSHFLTQRVRSVCPSNKAAIIKVVADTQQRGNISTSAEQAGFAHEQQDEGSAAGGHTFGKEGAALVPFRRKMICLFMSSPGVGELLIFVMYVKEYGSDCPGEYARRACVECADSTPLYDGHEEGKQRHDMLTATLLAYLEWAKLRGFREAVLNSPAPADDKNYIFAYRSLNVRVRTSSHFTIWYQRLLAKGVSTGVVHSYRTKSEQLLNLASLVQRDAASHVNTGDGAAGKERKRQGDSTSPAAMFFNGSTNGGGGLLLDATSGTDSTNGNSNSSSSPSSGSGDGDEIIGAGSNNGDSDQQCSNLNGNGGNDVASNGTDSCAHSLVGRSGGGSSEETSSQLSGGEPLLNTVTWFLAALQDPARQGQQDCTDSEPVVPSLLSNRDELVKFLEREQLKFHSLKSALLGTRRFVEEVLQEQQMMQMLPTMFGNRAGPLASKAMGQSAGVSAMLSMQAGVRSLSPGMNWVAHGLGGGAGGLGVLGSGLLAERGHNVAGGFSLPSGMTLPQPQPGGMHLAGMPAHVGGKAVGSGMPGGCSPLPMPFQHVSWSGGHTHGLVPQALTAGQAASYSQGTSAPTQGMLNLSAPLDADGSRVGGGPQEGLA